MELASLTEGVRSNEGNTGDGRTKSDSKTVRLKRKGERILPRAMPESTQGEETEPPRRTLDKVPQKKLASNCQRGPMTSKSKRQTRVALLERSRKLLHVTNATKVHVTAHPHGNRPGRENVGGIRACGGIRAWTRYSKTLKAQDARERGAVRVRRSWVKLLMTGTSKRTEPQ